MTVPELRIVAIPSESGFLREDIRRKILAQLKACAGVEIDIVIRGHKSQRSLEQNAYLHAVPFPMIAQEVGDSIDSVKHDLMGEYFGWTESKISGHVVPVKPHTSSMTVEECTSFIDWLIPWAAQTLNLRIPLPDEVAV